MQKGVITIWVLVFGAVFLVMLSGLIGFLTFQSNQNERELASQAAFHIAEAGMHYAKWHLAHSEDDFNFSGIYDYKDLEGAVVGQYQLEIESPTACSPGVKIKSSGWEIGKESEKRELAIVYAKTSMARYGFLTNSNAWFGEDENLKGPFHSNGGIRMDGTQNSLSTSAKENYICGAEHGCSYSSCNTPCSWTGSECECPGIWGDGDGEERGLWQFPSSNVDFDKLIQDLALLKQEAQATGIYLSDPSNKGFHLVFRNDGTVDVYSVKNLQNKVWGYDGDAWVYESNSIKNETFEQNFDLPDECSPIFVDGVAWVDGVVNGKATIAAARLPESPGDMKNIIISGNITYANSDSVLGLIAQKDILIPLYSPNNLTIEAAMLAQKGHVFRYYYPHWYLQPYYDYAIRDRIETFGSIITNTVWTFTWVNSGGGVLSGYKETSMNYDTNLSNNPPPFFPVSGDYKISSWEEVN